MLALRRNRNAETRFASWEYTGKSWRMGPNDVPIVPNAMEASYKRRVRCVRLQSKFTHNAADSCNDKKVFLAYDSLQPWLASGEAASIFWTHALMPPIQSNSRLGCESFAQELRGSIARDSLRHRQKMPRLPVSEEDVASSDDAQGAPTGTSQTKWSCVVRETHIAARLKNPEREREREETRYLGAPSMSSVALRPP